MSAAVHFFPAQGYQVYALVRKVLEKRFHITLATSLPSINCPIVILSFITQDFQIVIFPGVFAVLGFVLSHCFSSVLVLFITILSIYSFLFFNQPKEAQSDASNASS